MTTLTSIESEVLREVSDTNEDNWTGDSELREALADALDEICMVSDFFIEELLIPLEDDVMFYPLALARAWPLWIKNAWYLPTDRKLDVESLNSLAKINPSWLLSRGSPRVYIPYSSETIIVWPCSSSDGGVVRVEVVCTPKHYDHDEEFLSIREEFEQTLIAYGKYHLLLRSGGPSELWVGTFQDYIEGGVGTMALAHHKQAMRKYMFKEEKRN